MKWETFRITYIQRDWLVDDESADKRIVINITFEVWDGERERKRELHIDNSTFCSELSF